MFSPPENILPLTPVFCPLSYPPTPHLGDLGGCSSLIFILTLSLIMRDLLLLLCRYPFEESKRERLSDLLGEVQDWQKLVELINAHGIIALAAYNIKEAGLESKIPAEAMAILENGYLQSVVRNTWLTEHWKEVNTILGDAGIKYVLLKGMALEHTLYGSRGLRQMTDNDILVKKDDCLRAWSVLQQHGFTHAPIKSALHKKILTDIGKHLPELYREGYTVEIHYNLFDYNEEAVKGGPDPVDSSVEILIGGVNARILPNDIQMKYLVSHFNRHAEEGSIQIRQYADIILLDKTSNVIMPDKFIADPHQTENKVYRKAAYRKSYVAVPPKYRLRYLAGDIFPSVNWMKERYKCGLLKLLLYYPARLAKLMWLLRL